MHTKTCFKCQQAKPLDAFYAHPKMADGRLGKCKECTKADVKANREDRKDYYQEYERKRANIPKRVAARDVYRRTEAFRISHNAASARYTLSNPARAKANNAVSNAIRDGRLTRQPCHVCGELEVEGHHPDYSAPLDVVWLCNKHHVQLHVEHNEMMRQLQGRQSTSTKDHE